MAQNKCAPSKHSHIVRMAIFMIIENGLALFNEIIIGRGKLYIKAVESASITTVYDKTSCDSETSSKILCLRNSVYFHLLQNKVQVSVGRKFRKNSRKQVLTRKYFDFK